MDMEKNVLNFHLRLGHTMGFALKNIYHEFWIFFYIKFTVWVICIRIMYAYYNILPATSISQNVPTPIELFATHL